MKFLSKQQSSVILKKGLTYKKDRDNSKLREELQNEQKQFCAYTEKYIQELDSSEVEHFNSTLKYNDDYFNYYAVIRNANLYKKDEAYKEASFFDSLFFQNEEEFNSRIKYVGGLYYETDENDEEAKDLIDFLGFNHSKLYKQRKRHVKRLSKTFEAAKYSTKDYIKYFREHKEELSFITAIEEEFKVDLSGII